jgi:hypothetical protein
MNGGAQRFPYSRRDPADLSLSLMPFLTLTLRGPAAATVQAAALVDCGSTMNVMPHSLGLRLGFVWEDQPIVAALVGSLAAVEARAVAVEAVIGGFPPVRLAFGWAENDEPALLLGQTNFFMEFDVCLFRSRLVFDVRPKA